ncbi:MAG: DUF3387 domain-containing protein, partial [Gordonia sp. (in: high G+C Gram-positive bacteria)]
VDSARSDGVVDIYREAGLELPNLQFLTPEWVKDAQSESKVHLAIEALKASLQDEVRKSTAGNDVRSKQFSQRINDLMVNYTNQQLTAAEFLAALAEMAEDVAAEADRGKSYDPPLSDDELTLDVVRLIVCRGRDGRRRARADRAGCRAMRRDTRAMDGARRRACQTPRLDQTIARSSAIRRTSGGGDRRGDEPDGVDGTWVAEG